MTDSSSSSSSPLTCTPLLDRLALHSRQTPNKLAATFLGPGPDGGAVQRQLTYGELDSVTSRLAERLTAREGMNPGDRYDSEKVTILFFPKPLALVI
jgi:acyl-CoA synthetase (AMP-forming)/AMP-acid ligase II